MQEERALVPVKSIEGSILLIRGRRVMLDRELAELYGVPTKVLNQAVKRNAHRFPDDFVFRLTDEEDGSLRSQIVTSNEGRGGRRYAPYAFTEHGAIMAAMLLNTPRAIQASVFVVRAFVQLRQTLVAHKELSQRVEDLERKLATHDVAIREIIDAIKRLTALPPEEIRSRIGFRVGERRARYCRQRSRL